MRRDSTFSTFDGARRFVEPSTSPQLPRRFDLTPSRWRSRRSAGMTPPRGGSDNQGGDARAPAHRRRARPARLVLVRLVRIVGGQSEQRDPAVRRDQPGRGWRRNHRRVRSLDDRQGALRRAFLSRQGTRHDADGAARRGAGRLVDGRAGRHRVEAAWCSRHGALSPAPTADRGGDRAGAVDRDRGGAAVRPCARRHGQRDRRAGRGARLRAGLADLGLVDDDLRPCGRRRAVRDRVLGVVAGDRPRTVRAGRRGARLGGGGRTSGGARRGRAGAVRPVPRLAATRPVVAARRGGGRRGRRAAAAARLQSRRVRDTVAARLSRAWSGSTA